MRLVVLDLRAQRQVLYEIDALNEVDDFEKLDDCHVRSYTLAFLLHNKFFQ